MTKKDYIVFARMVKDLRKSESHYDKESMAVVRVVDVEDALANIFAADNGRFDRERFYKACGR
jgi:predicted metal-dependent hydrolase